MNTPEKEDPSQKEDRLQRNFYSCKHLKRQKLNFVAKCSQCGEDKEPKSAGVATELKKVAEPMKDLCADCTTLAYAQEFQRKGSEHVKRAMELPYHSCDIGFGTLLPPSW